MKKRRVDFPSFWMLTEFLYLVSFYQNITYCPICNISTCLPGQTWPPALSIFLSVVHLMQMFCTCSVTRHSNKRRHGGPLAPASLVWRPSQGHWSERDGAVLSTLSQTCSRSPQAEISVVCWPLVIDTGPDLGDLPIGPSYKTGLVHLTYFYTTALFLF